MITNMPCTASSTHLIKIFWPAELDFWFSCCRAPYNDFFEPLGLTAEQFGLLVGIGATEGCRMSISRIARESMRRPQPAWHKL